MSSFDPHIAQRRDYPTEWALYPDDEPALPRRTAESLPLPNPPPDSPRKPELP